MQYTYLQPIPDEQGRTVLLNADESAGRIYTVVFEGLCPDAVGHKPRLEAVFALHNRDLRPLRFNIRSMSVGDIVILSPDVCPVAYICDSVGWKKISVRDIARDDDVEPFGAHDDEPYMGHDGSVPNHA